MINTKNITKIIESNQQILDKCAYWFDTEKEVLKRYTQGVWKPVCNVTGGVSFTPEAPLKLYTDTTGQSILKLDYNEKDFKLNNDNQLTLIDNSSSKQSNGNGAITVKWCPRGKIDLDQDLNKPCIIQPRKRCPMIRFTCKYLRDKYTLKTVDNFKRLINKNYHDFVEENRAEIMSKLVIEDQPLRSPFCCHGPVITWKFSGFTNNIKTNCGPLDQSWPYYCINQDCMASIYKSKVRIKRDPTVKLMLGDNIQQSFTISPYITFVNPFTCYGGQIIVEKFNVSEDGVITLKFKIERIPSNVTYYEPCIKQYIKYNDWGMQCKGSYTYKKRMIFSTSYKNGYFKQLGIVNMYQQHQTNGRVNVINNSYNENSGFYYKINIFNDYLKIHKNILPISVDNIVSNAFNKLQGIKSKWARILQNSRYPTHTARTFILQDIDLLYAGKRTQSEYAERYKVFYNYKISLWEYKYIGIV